MKITNKIVHNNEVVGYLIGDSAFPMPLPTRALYTSLYMRDLIDAGYKFYDYAGKICDANGSFIVDLPPVDLSTIEDDEWQAGMGFAADALTDAEASRYYSFDSNVESVQFKEGNYEIHTRDELIRYLDSVKAEYKEFGYVLDNRPLNYFVAPEARFTIDEIVAGGLVATYIEAINTRRTFRNYIAYENLLQFLKEQGVLHSDNPTHGEVLQAYYAWGPEGINAQCVSSKFKMGVDGLFESVDDKLVIKIKGDPSTETTPATMAAANRDLNLLILRDNDMGIHYLRHHGSLRNVMSIEDFERSKLIISNTNKIMEYKRAQSGDFMYTAGQYGAVSRTSDRLYFRLRSEDGFFYLYKVSIDNSMLGLESGRHIQFLTGYNFRLYSQVADVTLSMNEVQSTEDYMLWNICLLRAAHEVDAKTVNPPIGNTYDILRSFGVSPISAVNYMVDKVVGKDGEKYMCSSIIKEKYEGLRTSCSQCFRHPVPALILDAFQLQAEEVADIIDFVDQADISDLLERRDLMLQGQLTPDKQGYDKTFIMDPKERYAADSIREVPDDAVYYYYNVKFLVDAMRGQVTIGNLGDGLKEDKGASLKDIASLLMTLMYVNIGNNPTVTEGINLLDSLVNNRIFNLPSCIRTRDNAYKGYLLDVAEIASDLVPKDSRYWMYTNKVFKELNNKPEDKVRPYMLEVICADARTKNDKLLMDICEKYIENTLEELSYPDMNMVVKPAVKNFQTREIVSQAITHKDLLKKFTRLLASDLFYKILGLKTTDASVYQVPLRIPVLEDPVQINIDAKVVTLVKNQMLHLADHVKYISLFDYNRMEYEEGERNRGFIYRMVNADVDMWQIKPKKGYKFNLIPIAASYYRAKDINTIGGEGFKESLAKTGAIANVDLVDVCTDINKIVCYMDISRDANLINNMYLTVRDSKYSFMLDEYDSFACEDYMFVYMKKWALLNREAKERGQICEHMPTKADIHWAPLASLLGYDAQPRVPTFKTGVNNSLLDNTVHTVKWNPNNAIESKNVTARIRPIIPAEVSLKDFMDIYLKLIVEGKMVHISSNYVTTPDGSTYLVPRMSSSEANVLVSNYGLRTSSGTYVASLSGIYKLEGV